MRTRTKRARAHYLIKYIKRETCSPNKILETLHFIKI